MGRRDRATRVWTILSSCASSRLSRAGFREAGGKLLAVESADTASLRLPAPGLPRILAAARVDPAVRHPWRHRRQDAGAERSMADYPYSYHIALDGNGINGFEGMAGVCVFRFNPADDSYAYK